MMFAEEFSERIDEAKKHWDDLLIQLVKENDALEEENGLLRQIRMLATDYRHAVADGHACAEQYREELFKAIDKHERWNAGEKREL